MTQSNKGARAALMIPLALTTALLALPTQAQQMRDRMSDVYRDGQPEVLPAPLPVRSPDAQPVLQRSAFSQAYARAGRPTIAVYWNRQLAELMEPTDIVQTHIETIDTRSGDGKRADEEDTRNITVTSQRLQRTEQRRSKLPEHLDLQLRSAFMQSMTSAGVRLVDRNVVIRTTSAQRKGPASARHGQHVESEALLQHAKLLMEVLHMPDAASPRGWSVHVSIKRMDDGVLLTEGYMDTRPPERASNEPRRFEADPNGGFREVLPSNTISDIGRRIGEQTLARLGEALATR
ncbi:hypothetical protein G7048_17980 [Diaphorobacter sp. HDW4B]|uniref:hypothetical protein n=1 Tax=Diaphorobacter sp. HDW4B TaxID=2714925 RepID=UPI00140A0609|nr:hypothetical protein [Diaphorobacter sp. HDW4B]QIL72081.1 hypothetical protein G7048_17980 [Diaphorobacter sp. HDW4B]